MHGGLMRCRTSVRGRWLLKFKIGGEIRPYCCTARLTRFSNARRRLIAFRPRPPPPLPIIRLVVIQSAAYPKTQPTPCFSWVTQGELVDFSVLPGINYHATVPRRPPSIMESPSNPVWKIGWRVPGGFSARGEKSVHLRRPWTPPIGRDAVPPVYEFGKARYATACVHW